MPDSEVTKELRDVEGLVKPAVSLRHRIRLRTHLDRANFPAFESVEVVFGDSRDRRPARDAVRAAGMDLRLRAFGHVVGPVAAAGRNRTGVGSAEPVPGEGRKTDDPRDR